MLYLETFSSLLILQCKHTAVETGVSSKPILKLTSCRSSSAAFSGFLHTGISFWLHVTQAVAFNPLPPKPKKGKLILQLLVIQVQMANTLFLANRTHTSSTLYGLHGPESYSNTSYLHHPGEGPQDGGKEGTSWTPAQHKECIRHSKSTCCIAREER